MQECKHAHGTLERMIGTRMPLDGSYSLEVVNPTDGSKGQSEVRCPAEGEEHSTCGRFEAVSGMVACHRMPAPSCLVPVPAAQLLPAMQRGRLSRLLPAAASQATVDAALKVFKSCFGEHQRCTIATCLVFALTAKT